MNCFDAGSGFRSRIGQTGHFIEGKLVVRKIKDSVNNYACLVAYVSTKGTSPATACYKSREAAKDDIVRKGHLREGDLDVYRIVDSDSMNTCLVTYVNTGSTSPSLVCYGGEEGPSGGGLVQTSYMREGDLVVRKIIDEGSRKECLVAYVSTEGTSPAVYCSAWLSAPEPAPAAKAPPAGQAGFPRD
jgi:hypothetical protein